LVLCYEDLNKNYGIITVLKKYITCFLVLTFLNYVGCYSSEVITNEKLNNGTAHIDTNDEIYFTTNDLTRYHFAAYHYQVVNDTIYGEGTLQKNGNEVPFDGKIAMNEINSIEQYQIDSGTTTGLTLGIMAVGVLAAGLLILALIADSFNPD